MNSIKISDLTEIRCVSDLEFSPDGAYSAFCVHEQSTKDNEYKAYIYLRDNATGAARRLTHSGKESGFSWDDNRTLIFQAERAEADKAEPFHEKTCFYKLDVTGGEAEKAFEIPLRVLEMKKLADGRYVMQVRVDLNALDPETTDKQVLEDSKDYMVFEEVPYRANGRGEISRIRSSLFIFDPADGKYTKITPDFCNVSSWDIKGNLVAYNGCEYDEIINLCSGMYIYDIATGEVKTIIEQGRLKAHLLGFTGDTLLYCATDMVPFGMGQRGDLYRYNLATGEKTLAWKSEFIMHDDVLFDCSRGGGKGEVIIDDTLYFVGMEQYNDSVYRFTGDNKMEKVVDFKGVIACIDVHVDEIQLVACQPNGLAELYTVEDGRAVKASSFNDEYLSSRYVAKAKYIPFTDSDGVKIDGWVLEPENFDPEKTYPGVLEIHGGPRCAYGEPFFHEMQVFVGMGCLVFFCNPRGSEGYGEEFADLRGKYGTVDYQDLMEFTDHVLKLYPNLDKARLAAAGGSYGGFMCNWIEGHTDRFAAIASQRSISNWIADYGGSEIGYTFDCNEMAADPWTDVLKVWEQSPLKYANNAKTPILFIHSECDYNCSLDQGLEMFAAMKYFGVPSRMCIFKGENHSLSRSGKPRHRARRLQEMCDWFKKYLNL